MSDSSKKFKKLIDQVAEGSTTLVSSPETISKMQEMGLPIKTTTVTYENYVETTFSKKRKLAVELIKDLPLIDSKVSDSTVTSIYEDLRESYMLGILSSAITNAMLLLEFAMRSRLYAERIKVKVDYEWELVERLGMYKLIGGLESANVINKDEEKELKKFNDDFRDPYLHINVKKLSRDIIIAELPRINVDKKEIVVLKNVKTQDYRFLWFAGKKFFDKTYTIKIVRFCVSWTNKLLR